MGFAHAAKFFTYALRRVITASFQMLVTWRMMNLDEEEQPEQNMKE